MMHKMIDGQRQKKWLEIRLEIPRAWAESISVFLFSQGSTGLIQEKIGRNKERFIAYFPKEKYVRQKVNKIRSSLADLCGFTSYNLETKVIAEEKWGESWKSNFKSVKVSPHLVVKPPWEKYSIHKGELVLQINPGMAFGTGTHPTTQMCLKFLDKLIPEFPRRPSVLDVGTGSGILAIAALKLGAQQVRAIDIDRLALKAARANAKLNKIHRGINFHLASPEQMRSKFDLVVTNLLPQEIMAVKDSLAARVGSHGILLISGFLKKQKKEIYRTFVPLGFHLKEEEESNGWASFVLKKDE
ncbi:MAG: 50S ribosomal protein L11 methyltransferase [Thermodesulfobacteriota bacterium]